MSRRDAALLADIRTALEVIARHIGARPLSDEVVFDAVRMRLVEVDEAVKGLSERLEALEPAIPWHHIAGMRNRHTHRYFENEFDIVHATVENDLPSLAAAIERLERSVQS